MEQEIFKKILFKVAFCAMACDGHIDDLEIKELHLIDKKTSYFAAIDLSQELEHLIDDFKNKGIQVIEELFHYLRETKLNTIQELLVLEVALRIVNADDKHDENEIKFVNLLRSKLELHDETINDRFGKLSILRTNEYSKNITIGKIGIEHIETMKIPELSVAVLENLKKDS